MKKLKPETKQKIIKLLIIVAILAVVCLAIYLPLKLTGTLEKIDSPEKLKEIILQAGAYSYILFFILQFLQVTFLPLPSFVTTVAGTLLFGPWIACGISLLAILLGAIFAFFLGKKVGRKLVVWVAGKDQADKWEKKLKRGNFVFFLMMLFPVFPDDILCIVAGTIGMSYKFFIITNIITRPIAIVTTCFLGSGTLIPFSGWGIPVWIVLVLIVAVLFFVCFKYQPQIENYIEKLAAKFSKKSKQNSTEQIENTGLQQLENNDNLQIENNQTKDNFEEKQNQQPETIIQNNTDTTNEN